MLNNNSHSLCLCPPLISLITFIAPPLIPFHSLLSQSSLFLSFLSILFSHSHCSSIHSFPFSSLTVIAPHFIPFHSLTAILESNFTGEPCPVQAYIPSKIEQSSMDKWTSVREQSNFIHRGYSSKLLYIHNVLFIMRGCANVVCFFVYLILYLAPLMRDY